ncbi:uncharacterized protein LOC135943260 [Cloeon dipterum]|uniref:uncharacterized protein LOC135943260 n=1 Tax=Cloeon dipterum TaxID=197152 RepID=UPI00321FBD56
MSKELRKVEMKEAAKKIDRVLMGNLADIEEKLSQIPGQVFEEPYKADFEDNETNSIKTEILRLASELVNGVAVNEQNEEEPILSDYSGLGLANVATQAQNYLKQLVTEQTQFLKKCEEEETELDQSCAMLAKAIAAMEIRLQSGEDIGEMGRLKEVTPEEERALLGKIKEKDTELQESLMGVIQHVFGQDEDLASEVVSELCNKVLKESGDPYIQVTDENRKVISLLRAVGLVLDHPHNPSKVKLIIVA